MADEQTPQAITNGHASHTVDQQQTTQKKWIEKH